jgi:formylglycine-generating enzyme required for sulfatase activity
MAQVFISYSHKDSSYAHQLADNLLNWGIEAWIDDRIDYGTSWPRVIQENLDACPVVIIILSTNSYNSDWVLSELSYAQAKKKDIFPILLEGENWVSLSSIQYIDARDKSLPKNEFFIHLQRTLGNPVGRKSSSVRRSSRTLGRKLILPFGLSAVLVTMIAVYLWLSLPATTREINYTGRVLDLISLQPVPEAQVTLDLGNVPLITYTDSEGIYAFTLRVEEQTSARVRVDASGYQVYTRIITVSPNLRTIEDIRLTPTKVAANKTEFPSPGPTATPVITLTPDPNSMVFIPAGEFLMGSNNDEDEKPIHPVDLDAFWIDRTEVTNGNYAECVRAGVCPAPSSIRSEKREFYYGNPNFVNYPVVSVSWEAANKYCNWIGKRLPTEAEWEKAARGTDGRMYPWGNDLPGTTLLNYKGDEGDTTQVGQYQEGASFYGALDMAGNVWEWASDWYDPNYYSNSPSSNPKGPKVGDYHVLRGGAWYSPEYNIRATARERYQPSSFKLDIIGFRCAKSEP